MFGLALVLTQFSLRYASPNHGALVTIPTSAILLWILAPLLLDWQSWDLSAAVIFAVVGTCNGIGVLALYAALARGPVLLVSPLVATYPLVTLALTAILFRSARISASLVVGVTMTVAGVIFVVAT
jgi:drug/metabolite transporter (DMT)-like permease